MKALAVSGKITPPPTKSNLRVRFIAAFQVA
jgi:hypothetical protein